MAFEPSPYTSSVISQTTVFEACLFMCINRLLSLVVTFSRKLDHYHHHVVVFKFNYTEGEGALKDINDNSKTVFCLFVCLFVLRRFFSIEVVETLVRFNWSCLSVPIYDQVIHAHTEDCGLYIIILCLKILKCTI